MGTRLLQQYAIFSKMTYLEKRSLFTNLVTERLGWHCEARIYRVLTRLTFQTLRKKHEITFAYTNDERQLLALFQTLNMSPSTVLRWYYDTRKKQPLYLADKECANSTTGNICDCCVDEGLRIRIKQDYDYNLASKRLYQLIVKLELIKEALKEGGVCLPDEGLRKSLRRLVEHQYYPNRFRRRTRYFLQETDFKVQDILRKKNIGSMAVLRWLYVLNHHPELVRKAQQNEIEPEAIFEQPMMILRDEFRNRGDLLCK